MHGAHFSRVYKFGYSAILCRVSHHILGLSLALPSPKALYGL